MASNKMNHHRTINIIEATHSAAPRIMDVEQISPQDTAQFWSGLDPRGNENTASGSRESHDFLEVKLTPATPRSSLDIDKPKGPLFVTVIDGDDGKGKVVHQDPLLSKQQRSWLRYAQTVVLLVLWLAFTVVLITYSEKVKNTRQVSIAEGQLRSYWILVAPPKNQVLITLEGAFLPPIYGNLSTKWMTVWLEQTETNRTAQIRANITTVVDKGVISTRVVSQLWLIPLVVENLLDHVPLVQLSRLVTLANYNSSLAPRTLLRLQMRTNLLTSLSVLVDFDSSPLDSTMGAIYAAIVLCGLYFLIIFETIDRTLAAILASTTAVALLAFFDERPTMGELISWIDAETLLLLFSMMVLVAVLSETGVFDYLAVYAYKITGGSVWSFVGTLCLFTAVLSSVLDNVTTVLLMTPVTIRLCEVLRLNPVPVLTTMILYSNIGGAATPVGDPPNAIIASNPDIIKAGVDFAIFTLHVGLGTLLVGVVTLFQLRFVMFRDLGDLKFSEPDQVQDLRREIAVLNRAASSLSSYSKDEDVVKQKLHERARVLSASLQCKAATPGTTHDTYKMNLEELQSKYPIRDKVLLVKSGLTLVFVISFFFLHSIPGLHLSLGWTALLGAILLLVLADNQHMEEVLSKVEWNTLLFFAALFILMESLARLGLLDFIGHQTEVVILSVGKSSRLAVSILLVLWVSAIASAFIDNIPLTTMMVRIVTSLAQNPDLQLPLQPLVWALAFGACLGGNGTLIGASANVVCSGVAEQHGYKFSFKEYFKIGFPVMIVSIVVISLYLIIAHELFTWH